MMVETQVQDLGQGDLKQTDHLEELGVYWRRRNGRLLEENIKMDLT